MITANEFYKWLQVFNVQMGPEQPLTYLGTWNANTNTPTLTSSVGTAQTFYIVNVPGNTILNGVGDWVVGDWVVFNGSVWQKIPVGEVEDITPANLLYICNDGDDSTGLDTGKFLTLAGLYGSIIDATASNRYVYFDVRGVASESVTPEILPFITGYGCGTEISFPAGLNLNSTGWNGQDADALIDGYIINEPTQLLLSFAGYNQSFKYNLTLSNIICKDSTFRFVGFGSTIIGGNVPNINLVNIRNFDGGSTADFNFVDALSITPINCPSLGNITQLMSTTGVVSLFQTLNAFGSAVRGTLTLTAGGLTSGVQLLSQWNNSPYGFGAVVINNFQGSAYQINFLQDQSNWTPPSSLTINGVGLFNHQPIANATGIDLKTPAPHLLYVSTNGSDDISAGKF